MNSLYLIYRTYLFHLIKLHAVYLSCVSFLSFMKCQEFMVSKQLSSTAMFYMKVKYTLTIIYRMERKITRDPEKRSFHFSTKFSTILSFRDLWRRSNTKRPQSLRQNSDFETTQMLIKYCISLPYIFYISTFLYFIFHRSIQNTSRTIPD